MADRRWCWCVLLPALGTDVRATELEKPAGPVILTVAGAVSATDADGAAELDRGPPRVACPRDRYPRFMDAAQDTTWNWQLSMRMVQ
jgi:hypothetical protein